MTQQRIIRSHERAPGGYYVTIEVTNAYTNGESRYDRVFVAEAELVHQDDDGVMDAVTRAALDPAPLARVRDLDVAAYRELKRVTDKPIEALRSLAASLAQPPQIPAQPVDKPNGELNPGVHGTERTP
jgi:hypothetical protein